LNDVGYFYGENAIDKDQLLNLVTWCIGHSLNPKKFKTEIFVHDRANKKKYSCECKYASMLVNLLPTSLDAYTMQK